MKSIKYAQKVADKILGRNSHVVQDVYMVNPKPSVYCARIAFFNTHRGALSSIDILGRKAQKISDKIASDLTARKLSFD